jgi:hypothetical protein
MKRLMVLAVLVSFGAQARSFDYGCYSFFANGSNDQQTMDLSVNARKATADIHEASWDNNLGGNLDSSYHSRGNVPFVKFGNELIVEKALLTGGKRLRDGSWGGVARVEGQAEGGFFQYKFICKLK